MKIRENFVGTWETARNRVLGYLKRFDCGFSFTDTQKFVPLKQEGKANCLGGFMALLSAETMYKLYFNTVGKGKQSES